MPERLEALILSCLAKQPEPRPSSAALLAALAHLAPAGADRGLGGWPRRAALEALPPFRALSSRGLAGAGVQQGDTAATLAA